MRLAWAPIFFFVYLWCDVTGVVVMQTVDGVVKQAESLSSKEEDVARGTGVQPYRFEPRRSNNGDEESDASELTLRYNTRIKGVSPNTVHDRCSLLFAELRYDMIRYIYVRSKADKMASLVQRTAQKQKIKKNCKTPISSEETVGQKSVKAVREEEVELRGIGFVKQVGFKPGVKERGRYG